MFKPILRSALAASLLAGTALASQAAENFNRISTFHVVDNLPAGADASKKTVAEIITATPDGKTLVYTDSPGERIGLIDITDPKAPKAAGTVALGGEPTSTVVIGGYALVGVVTSKSKSEPSGHLSIVDLATKTVKATCDLAGQPDSLAKSPDGKFLAIAIENERDEEINDGAIPQLPGGNLTSFAVAADGTVDCASKNVIDVSGLAAIAPEDPEPEFVDINDQNQVVLTLQENNEIVIADLATGKVVKHFSAGTVDLAGIDTKKDGVIDLSGKMEGVAREPDGVQWIDSNRFFTANEGDWKGGSRGFTIFTRDGAVDYDSGTAFEYETIRLGHYPEKRNKKGNEPEGAEVATFGADKLIFVGSERASLIGVYKDEGAGKAPTFLQALPGGIGPEGLLAIPARNLFVTASENDLREDGLIGSVVTIYERSDAPAAYPTIVSADKDGKPIGWAALSGTVGDAKEAGKLYAVIDSAQSIGRILTIDANQTPALITDALTVTKDGKPAENLDLEGIALASDGGFWLASEGNPEREKNKTQSTLVRVDAKGAILEEIALPETLAAQATRFGFEGVTVTGSGADETVWLAVQREWKDDPKGFTKLLAYKPASKEWAAVLYPLDKAEKGWVGLSEITAVPGGLVVIERDNQVGRDAAIKKLTFVSLDGVKPAPLGGELPKVEKKDLADLLPALAAPHGYVLDKVESFAIDAAGNAFVITDNDGVDGHSGETQFIRLGKVALPM
ncbi:esterase-like activity of phytase family protein [Kaistia dalseonensis]|uniref:Sugar lactone lactonase YvrE n=1 Tax=Kaistia dalseonensis TaxID=410840 RepID=A0ABU0HBQ8_9HYPH|nr:esterase-like activity of phytase family protein [Kaistia dalseonensis]MCX5497069.1 esterase-like activity of phytase family protein [Kaistia dalseonensis]MDQ0439695.1 sugar lactone lactonase YvrE [Kaistia dalseonensis]